ncbi:AIR synthase-related protein [uncultured Eubacterium sp.]|uniref:AIR synthase-related protein n=1 Tax=uncultured Eubacterium sp. TaxID=165185 RepID=UPI000ED77F04|nr:AIR synthase-related protein [uncultured Eubacterium sp.]HAH17872.1 hypothetical protein [Eubacterium sp.]
MNINSLGKVKESIINRSILKNMDVIGTSATKIAEGVDEIEYAYAKAVNSAWVSLCRKPNKVSVAITLPKEYDEEKLKDIARLCDGLAKENDLQISGGSTIVSDKVTDVIVSFTVFYDEVLKNQSDDFADNIDFGRANDLKAILLKNKKEVKSRIDSEDIYILMTAYTGIEGTAYLFENFKEKIHEVLGNSLDTSYEKFKSWINVSDHVESIVEVFKNEIKVNIDLENKEFADNRINNRINLFYIDNLGTGGIYEGLSNLASSLNCGFEVDLKKIPIRQETVEACNIMDVNPYMMRSAGSVVFATSNPDEYISRLEDKGIPVSIIGKLSKNNDKIIMIDDEKKYVEPFKGDVLKNIH